MDTSTLKSEVHQIIASAVPLIPGVPTFADGIIDTVADGLADLVIDHVLGKLLGGTPAPAPATQGGSGPPP